MITNNENKEIEFQSFLKTIQKYIDKDDKDNKSYTEVNNIIVCNNYSHNELISKKINDLYLLEKDIEKLNQIKLLCSDKLEQIKKNQLELWIYIDIDLESLITDYLLENINSCDINDNISNDNNDKLIGFQLKNNITKTFYTNQIKSTIQNENNKEILITNQTKKLLKIINEDSIKFQVIIFKL